MGGRLCIVYPFASLEFGVLQIYNISYYLDTYIHIHIFFYIFTDKLGSNLLFIYLFIFSFCLPCAACGILVPWPSIKPVSLALGEGSLNHWTTSKVPISDLLKNFVYLFFGCAGSWLLQTGFSLAAASGSSSLAAMCGLFEVACLLQILDCRVWRRQSQQQVGSVTVVHRLSCSVACGIILDQGLNLCPLHCQAEFFTTGQPGKSKLGSSLNKICFVIPGPKTQISESPLGSSVVVNIVVT